MFQKEIGLCAQNKLAVLSSIVNIFGGGGGMMWSFKKKYKLQKSWQKRLQMISTNCMFHIMQVGLELKVTV